MKSFLPVNCSTAFLFLKISDFVKGECSKENLAKQLSQCHWSGLAQQPPEKYREWSKSGDGSPYRISFISSEPQKGHLTGLQDTNFILIFGIFPLFSILRINSRMPFLICHSTKEKFLVPVHLRANKPHPRPLFNNSISEIAAFSANVFAHIAAASKVLRINGKTSSEDSSESLSDSFSKFTIALASLNPDWYCSGISEISFR